MKQWAVVGLGFGDEGKGSIVDYLCATNDIHYVVRFNGGAQAAHNVVLPDGTHHTFSQYGSGTLRGVRTILSRHMMVEPMGFLVENQALKTFDIPGCPLMPIVDEECLLITPYHIAVNRLREQQQGHGSCGLGIGVTAQFALEEEWAAPRVKDILSGDLGWKMGALGLWALKQGVEEEFDLTQIRAAYQIFLQHVIVADSTIIKGMLSVSRCVFEGAQGVLLDEWHGFHPHTTWSTTTFDNIADLVADPTKMERIGVLRSYMTRHGAGPMPTEQADLSIIAEEHNDNEGMQGAFRMGDFDLVLANYALEVCGGVDSIALTHMDVAENFPLSDLCIEYEVGGEAWVPTVSDGHDLNHQAVLTGCLNAATPCYMSLDSSGLTLVQAVMEHLETPVSIVSYGPTSDDKKSLARV